MPDAIPEAEEEIPVLPKKPLANVRAFAHRTDSENEPGPGFEAARHAVTGHVVIQSGEDMRAFERFTAEIVSDLTPETAVERQLAHLYALYQWRINRAAAIEDTLFSIGLMEGVSRKINIREPNARTAVSHATTFRGRARVFEKIAVYSQSLLAQSIKSLAQLKRLQAQRKKQAAGDMTDAACLYLYHRKQNLSFDPKENGFDLTLEQIEDHIRRTDLQSHARSADKVAAATV